MLSRRELLSALAAAPLLRGAGERKPNIVILLADDQGWGDLSISGNKNLSTPNIDSLARDGALFDRFFVCPVCSPTRAEMLTGRYHARGGVRGVSEGQERLNLDERTIAETFKANGYATGAFGKWHNGSQFPYHPNARGFDEYYGFTAGHWANYFDTQMDHNGLLTQGKGYITDDLTDHAMAFIEKNKAGPFFCYVPFNTPHSPMQVPLKYWEKFKDFDPVMRNLDPAAEDLGMTRAALAMCENIDWNVGRVLKQLDELKLANDTIVLYFSDNGPASARWNGGMRGRKGSTDEGGVRSPLMIRWPGQIRPGTRVTQIAGAIDLLPTLADLAGIRTDSGKPLDGVSLKPLLTGARVDWADRRIYSLWNKKVSVRTQRYRLDSDGRLYDMVADPGQTKDVAAAQAMVAGQLRKAVADWSAEMLPLLGPDDRPYPVGYSKLTWLPARDGVGSGGVKRSNRYPNSSFFTNWTSKDGRIEWDVEVGTPGEFDAVVYYTCAAADVGSVIEMSLGSAKASAKVVVAHDPPLRGAEEDRVVRIESYWKEFRPLNLGRVRLEKGRGKLTLRAAEVAGKSVADIFY
ncbi:MAG TPA: arylsulfatase, partial [Bryobacteraceae bacterium]|nr:arylsulfatase [Bryobacteraceae bacterium]